MVRSARLLSFVVLAALVLVLATASVSAQERRGRPRREWVKLAEREVARSADREEIDINAGPDYSRISFRVHGQPIRFYRCRVYYLNDDPQDIEIGQTIVQGQDMRPLDLRGRVRHITHITIWCKTESHSPGSAIVALWGLR